MAEEEISQERMARYRQSLVSQNIRDLRYLEERYRVNGPLWKWRLVNAELNYKEAEEE
jgi:hypothetical protein